MAEMAEEQSIEIVSGETLNPGQETSSAPPTQEVQIIEDLTDSLEKMTEAYKTVSESGDSLPSVSRTDSASLESRYKDPEKDEMRQTIDSLQSQLSSIDKSGDRGTLRKDKEMARLKRKLKVLEDELKDKDEEFEEEKKDIEKRHERERKKLMRDNEKLQKRKDDAEKAESEAREEIERLEKEREELEAREDKLKTTLKDKIKSLESQLKSAQLRSSGDEVSIDREEIERLKREKAAAEERERSKTQEMLVRIKSLEEEVGEAKGKASIRLEDDATLRSLTEKHDAEVARLQTQIRQLKVQVDNEKSSKEEEIIALKTELETREAKIKVVTENLEKEMAVKAKIMERSKELIREKVELEKRLENVALQQTPTVEVFEPTTTDYPNGLSLSNNQREHFQSVQAALAGDPNASQRFSLLQRDFDELLEYVNMQKKELELQRSRVKKQQEEKGKVQSAEDVRREAEEAIAMLVGVTCNLQEQLEDMTTPGRGQMFVKPLPKYNGSERFVGKQKPTLF